MLGFQESDEMTGKRRFVIDSRFRKSGEEPDSYTIELLNPLGRIGTIALVASNVPFSAPTIGRGNDTIDIVYLTEPSRRYATARLATGPVASAQELATVVQAAFPDDITVTLNGQNRLAFACNSTPFALYGSGSIVRLLGLHPGMPSGVQVTNPRLARGGVQSEPTRTDVVPDSTDPANTTTEPNSSETIHNAIAPYSPDLSPEPYLLLTSNVAGAIESPEQSSDGALAVLSAGIVDVAHPVVSKATSSEFHRMTFRIRRPTGEDYDFQGHNHRLEFDIE